AVRLDEQAVDVSEGVRQVQLGDRQVQVRSEWASEDVWRLVVGYGGAPAQVAVTGNLGSDGATQGFAVPVPFAGAELVARVTNDGGLDDAGGDPQVVALLVPAALDQLDALAYQLDGDGVTWSGRLAGGFTLYVAVGGGAAADVVAALADDLLLLEDDAPRVGAYTLTVALLPACGDGLDNDGDGLVDRWDPGCESLEDGDEAHDPNGLPECSDGVDQDGDGRTDFPFAPGCTAAGDLSEALGGPLPACSNDADDDGDGLTDFPLDPGCDFAADGDEVDAFLDPPACADGVDNDGNGRVDFPDDPGCAYAAEPVEAGPNPPPARCADGVDNDQDGRVDVADPGCVTALDDDEVDPDVPPACGNGADDDGDGAVDFPADDGCEAAGDACEQPGWRLCAGGCIPVDADPQNCGRCGRVCAEGVACQDGRCGDLRPVVKLCGASSRDVTQFIRGELAQAEVQVVPGCDPDDQTQALLVTRNGIAQVEQAAAGVRAWVADGGQLIGEFSNTHRLWTVAFEVPTAQGPRRGDCQDNVQPAVQLSPQDPFWQALAFEPVPAGQTGCGYEVGQFAGLVPLGGWAADQVSIGYRDLGGGRVWAVDLDWQDNQGMTALSLDMMAAMIRGQ
ncbi:MAG: hypothetical protein KC613_17550, partial [Myxococcales bacterium]|nr:hypothetical protein [Myxococcales bacterium]